MRSQTSGKQAVSVTYRERIFTGHAVCRKATRHHFRPYRQVFARISYNRRIARCARRSMHPHDFRFGGSHQPVGIIVAQVLLGGERQFHYIVDAPDVFGHQVHFLHLVPVEGHIVVNVSD